MLDLHFGMRDFIGHKSSGLDTFQWILIWLIAFHSRVLGPTKTLRKTHKLSHLILACCCCSARPRGLDSEACHADSDSLGNHSLHPRIPKRKIICPNNLLGEYSFQLWLLEYVAYMWLLCILYIYIYEQLWAYYSAKMFDHQANDDLCSQSFGLVVWALVGSEWDLFIGRCWTLLAWEGRHATLTNALLLPWQRPTFLGMLVPSIVSGNEMV